MPFLMKNGGFSALFQAEMALAAVPLIVYDRAVL